ncbi:PLD-like domain-containing protein [Vreelandella arcis]|uniref:PLD-like domain-containing protein n=2 Tax=Vreelandella arcis TaxID=416873 RepID=A0A1H0IAD8_9GAMM|nr:PLD-like domain-containing protein [Halomonas arcis]
MVITVPEKLRSTLAEVAPTHVAVAYLGSGWQEYLTNLDALEAIVVSPTIGSYPGALTELLDEANQHDFRVYFRNTLHAKLFVGDDACLIGSANLSQNGFDGGLNEAAVYLTDSKSVDQAHDVFETLKQGAVHDTDKQRSMIRELWPKWNLARRNNVLPNEGGERPQGTILDWKPGYECVWLAWVDKDEKPILNESNVREAVPEIGVHQPEQYFDGYTNLVEGDDVRVGDWLIIWVAKGDSTPNLGMSPYWMRVDQLISGGVVEDGEEDYTLLAVMLPSHSDVTPPFDIDGDPVVKHLIKQLLASGDYPKLMWSVDNAPWCFTEAWEDNQRFLVELQQAYSKEVS